MQISSICIRVSEGLIRPRRPQDQEVYGLIHDSDLGRQKTHAKLWPSF